MTAKHRRKRLARHLEAAFELPDGTLCRTLRMELTANREAIVEGCQRVLQYEEDRISLDTVDGEVRFEGENLCVNCLVGGNAVVSGHILTIGFHM